jgi:uncharacterized membrane protein/thiol-disulfide isomerase/thioredoxin
LVNQGLYKHKVSLTFTSFAGLLVMLLAFFIPGLQKNVSAQSQNAIVRVVLFYSPTCPHCEKVIQQDLPPLVQKYGGQLDIKYIDVTQAEGLAVFKTAMKKFGQQRGLVPMLVVGNVALTGSDEIPAKFPGLVEKYLAEGGMDWPDIAGLTELLNLPAPTPQPESGLSIPEGILKKALANLAKDPAGNALALFVLAGMLTALLGAMTWFVLMPGAPSKGVPNWVIPVLCVLGLGVAGYLAFIETTATAAVCGPVGHCNAVQNSEYTKLFDLLPISSVGLIGYSCILAAWLLARWGNTRLAQWAMLALLGMTVTGTFYSTYLTFLEPFVIGATCIWCLTSAVLMTLLMLLAVRPGKLVFKQVFGNPSALK